ncbi:leucine-rich repeat-containing protein 49-like isoform X2 [Dendronephthya gigantea]|uniref:leucine-rich repeat-containing protein 49-like isoform X2 n=1 Tax=Dendronephthya gigantea TaxID=151771 RepID=UPI00106C645A|nr:leucine-rich repeat-containing protein 49-like isoform X2 [Dendronephthya gigantea]
MFHYPSKTSKSGRVVQKDSGNLGLHYSFQAHATTVNERPTPRQNSGERKTVQENDFLITPSVSNPIIHCSARFRISPSTENESSIVQSSEAPELVRQNTQTFHDLNRVQRQILHPVPASMTDSFSLAANIKHKDSGVKLPQRTNNSTVNNQDKHFSDLQLPGDRVLFTETASAPGVPVVYRLPEDRHTNPDRLNLDRRKLNVCPILEGEDHVRLLNFQHNMISKIENISQLKRLIFLDFYDNHLECISGLSSLKSLRVLMLGKNRIRKIENLDALTKLDVLDLHGNKLSSIDNLNHLSELRVLNLAGNDISVVRNLHGMQALAELNLRRNKIVSVSEIDQLPNLQRLFLSFNSIQSFDDIRCLSQCNALSELSIDGNPFSLEVSYKHCVLRNVPNLRQFDMRRITEEEKRLANVISKKEDDRKKEQGRITHIKEKKRMAINNAQKQWEMFHVDSPGSVNSKSSLDDKTSATETLSQLEGVSDSTICHLAELEGETLYLYGPGSLDALDRNWGQQAANTVTNVVFKFIDFDDIVPHLGKIQIKFPVVQNLVFSNTNIKSLPQINALAVVKHLECLTISDDNPVTYFHLWKPYTLFRLAHLSLHHLNDMEITGEDIVKAEKLFGTLSHFTTSNLPQSRLLSLLGDNRKRQAVLDSEKAKKSEGKHERTLSNEGLGRAGLLYRSPQMVENAKTERNICQVFCENFVKNLVETCVSNHEKTMKLESLYPQILQEMVQEYLKEMKNFDKFVEKSLEKV